MRGFAIFFVIFNHTGTNGFNLFSTYQPASLQFWISLGVAIFCKFSVPVFFAISGALALGKDPEPLGRLWRKKILKFSLILIIISLIYYLELIYKANGNKLILEKGWINDFILKLYSGDVRTHLWYMYAFIAYLIGLPFLQSLVKHLE
ncbi:MAG: acyltransferase family protein, partial [Peptostreptococcus sp.]|nr:acyltransferase family protein [Peptostreptococcus sp.]